MSTEIFKGEEGDQAFFNWMNNNPNGYVLNTYRSSNASYVKVHESNCFHISGSTSEYRENAFTGQDYIKICSNDIDELSGWVQENRRRAIQSATLCKTCEPDVDLYQFANIYPDEAQTDTLTEGGKSRVTVNRYERDRKARNRCLEHYGYDCQVCGLNFEKEYGEIGRKFIHVHHIKPVSKIDEKYEIDPIEDLRPVCPNCHAMIHRDEPPYTIEQIQKQLDN